MKIKHIFEEGDFIGCGQLLVQQSDRGKPCPYMNGFKVGYSSEFLFLFAMSDGGVIETFTSKPELCNYLNGRNYRPMTEDEIKQLANYGNRFQKNA